jgi:hypothetical protein
MLRQNPHLQLMGALGFSASDIAANSQGELSPHQHAALRESRNLQVVRWGTLVVFLWVIGLIVHLELLALLFISAVIVSVIMAAWARVNADLAGGVQMMTGRLDITADLPFVFTYRLDLSGETFHVARGAGAAFQPGRIYRLYYTALSRTLLSAELIA